MSTFKIRVVPTVRSVIDTKLYEMKDFIDFLSSAIKMEKKKVEKRLDEATKRMSKSEKDKYYDLYSEDYWKIDDVFAQTSINSSIVVLCSYIETGLNALCDAYKLDKEIPLRYLDMRGQGIDRSKIYLEKVIGLNFPSNSQSWAEIRALKKLRNAIVHDEGWASKDILSDSCIKKHIENELIQIETRKIIEEVPGKFIVKFEYLKYVTEQVNNFFKSLTIL